MCGPVMAVNAIHPSDRQVLDLIRRKFCLLRDELRHVTFIIGHLYPWDRLASVVTVRKLDLVGHAHMPMNPTDRAVVWHASTNFYQ